jgi:hypothetical protein
MSTNIVNKIVNNATTSEQSECQISHDDSPFVFPPKRKVAKIQSDPSHNRYVINPSQLSLGNKFK